MKSYTKTKGWIFDLVGGPHNATSVRLPFMAKGDNTVENLDETIRFYDKQRDTYHIYELQPKYKADGMTRAEAAMGSGVRVEAYQYNYQGEI